MVLTAFLQSPWRVVDAIPEEHRTIAAAVAGALVVVPAAVWLVVSSRPKHSSHRNKAVRLPAVLPSTLPVVANLLDILKHKDSRHDWFTRLGEQYQGRPFQFRMPGRVPVVVVYTPELAEDALKTHFDNVPKGPVQRENFRDVLGHGIFAADGVEWLHQRKTASNLFTARALRDTMAKSMRQYAVILQRVLLKACNAGETIDVFELMSRFTIEAFAKMGFGVDMNCLESEANHPFHYAFDSAQRVLMERLQRPVWFWKLQRFLNLGNEAQLKKDIVVIDTTVMDIIAQALATREQHTPTHKGASTDSVNIVGLFLDHLNGEKLDVRYLRDVVVNFLIAGRDTTAQTMTWCLYNLSQHPEVLAKIREEIDHMLPGLTSGRRTEMPTMDEVQRLVYLDATLKETLRLHPPVPVVPKAVTNDVVFSDGTLMRGGSVLVISTYAMARMEFVWGPDAKQFKPERFIDATTGKLLNVSAFKFASFNAGPRMCLGMNLAMVEMKIVLASMLSRFNIDVVPGQHITYGNSLTLPVKGAMLAHVTKA